MNTRQRKFKIGEQRWSRGHKPRGQGHKKKFEAKAKDSPFNDRLFRDQGQKYSTPSPRTQTQVLSQKEVLKIFFKRSPNENKKGLHKISAKFLAFSNKILMIQKIVLFSRREQGNFRGFVASRPRTSKCVLDDFTSVGENALQAYPNVLARANREKLNSKSV